MYSSSKPRQAAPSLHHNSEELVEQIMGRVRLLTVITSDWCWAGFGHPKSSFWGNKWCQKICAWPCTLILGISSLRAVCSPLNLIWVGSGFSENHVRFNITFSELRKLDSRESFMDSKIRLHVPSPIKLGNTVGLWKRKPPRAKVLCITTGI